MKTIEQKIQELTDCNDHSGAVVALAKHCKRLVKEAEAVQTLHSFFGYMPSDLHSVREEVKRQLLSGLPRSKQSLILEAF
jgi:hypothetical protein